MGNYNFIRIEEINVLAIIGSHITDCLKESIILAAKQWLNVRLIHNDKEYMINPNVLLRVCCEPIENNKEE